MYSFTKNEKLALAGSLLLLLPALLFNLGLVPLYAEEPRRATVALEMMLRDNWLVPTINGEIYQLKPPVFNWILASFYSLAGGPSELITRIPTVISLLLLGLVIFLAGKKYVSPSFGALSALLFVTASGNLFFNSLLAEIDMFYSLVTYTALISLFHFYQQKKYLLLFLSVYFLGAVGILTKGLPSLVFTGLSLLAFFIANKDFRRLFSPAHFAGILLFLLITAGYFLAYARNGGDLEGYLLNLSVESGKRFSGDTFWDYLQHMALYPLDTLMNLLPASILLLFTFRKSFIKDAGQNSFVKFALLMLLVHFPVYWLPPGGRQRYIIMLYPFILQVFTFFFLKYFTVGSGKYLALSRVITVATALAAAACFIPLFTGTLPVNSALIIACVLSFLALISISFISYKIPGSSIIALIYSLIILRFVFGFAVLPVRATEGRAPANRDAALEIAALTRGEQVCILTPTYFPMQSVFYYEKERMEILPLCSEIKPGSYYIVENVIMRNYTFYRENSNDEYYSHFRSDPYCGNDQDLVPANSYETILDFTLQKRDYRLIRPVRQRL